MRNERYELEISGATTIFDFMSEGPKGLIKKRVQYVLTHKINVYNLAFGDIIGETNDFDDEVITNNEDSRKVLATVASTIYTFTKAYPDAVIYAEGRSPARTRLYRISISNNLEELKEKFRVYGFLENVGWFPYEINKNYSAFYIKRKK